MFVKGLTHYEKKYCKVCEKTRTFQNLEYSETRTYIEYFPKCLECKTIFHKIVQTKLLC